MLFGILRIFFAVLVIIVVLGQAPRGENALLTQLNDTGFFASYRETKMFLRILTWSSILGFLIVEYIPSNVWIN